jgi:hypothetical protein
VKRIVLIALRFSIVPLLLMLGTVTGGLDGYVGWFVLAWMLWRGGPAMWGDVKNVCRWFFGMQRRFSIRGAFGRRSAGGDLNV